MPGVVELIDQAVDLPPGPRLGTLLAELPWSRVPNARLVEVLQARSRQLAHDQARLLAGMAEIARAVPVAGLPEHAVARADEDFEWASHEIAAALTWTPTAADRELGFALVLRSLPLVLAALDQGLIDRGKATVFCDHLDPARGELTPAQIRRLCERFVPLAPRWTARQLSRRLLAAIQAIDPDYHRRRYRRGLRERGVMLYLNRDGTATLSGEGLPPDEAAAAAARLDRLAEAAKRAGHPGRLGQITADLYLGMLDGSFHGLTEAQILDRLLAQPRPDDIDDVADTGDGDGAVGNAGAAARPTSATASTRADTAADTEADTAADSEADSEADTEADSEADTAADTEADTEADTAADTEADSEADNEADSEAIGIGEAESGAPGSTDADTSHRDEAHDADSSGTDISAAGSVGADSQGDGSTDADPADEESAGECADQNPADQHPTSASPAAAKPHGTGEDRWRRERIAIREGIELRVGLATVLGCDQRPAEIPGLGPVDAHIARTAVARQRRGARWRFAILDPHGHLLLAGPLRRRPRTTPPGADPPDRVRGGVIELHLTLAELRRFATDPDLIGDRAGDWAGVVAEIADRWADRHRLWRELARNPRARFARGALADHVRIRDRTCIGPGCDRSARRSQLDHTIDHGRGGDTVEGNLGPGCWRHHRDKDRGWTLSQPEPGHFVWISPLGRTYRTRREPVRPDLPDPEPPPDGTDHREDPDSDHRIRPDLHILWRQGRNPDPPPPPVPADEEQPPF